MGKMRVRVWVIVVGLPLVALLPVFIAYGAVEKQTKKIVFLWSPAPGHHPNWVSCELLMECLENSPNVKGIKCESYDTWPENPGVLDENELYHNLCFAEENCPVPILRTTFPDKKTKEMKEHIVAWALERKDGGRGFGFGGGHFFSVWINNDCRKMILNAILWTAKIEVPNNGVQSAVVPELLKTEKKGQH